MVGYSQGTSTGGSASGNYSGSSSSPEILQTPQSQWELALSQMLQQLGSQQYQWAQQQFANAQGVTDANISNYIDSANAFRQQSNNLWGRYQSVFEPLTNKWIQEAGSYASTPRQQFNMGRAQSDVGQAFDAAKANSEQQLQSFGIDPSSGRYAELEQASAAKRAAAQAGAGQQAELATEQTGRQMQQTAMAAGEQLPGAAINAGNAALAGIAGAQNSILGLENTGVNLMDSASPYFNEAMNLRNPNQGQQSSSSSRGGSASANTSQHSAQTGGGGGGSGYGGRGGGYTNGGGYGVTNPEALNAYGSGYGGSMPSTPGGYSNGGYAGGGVIPSGGRTTGGHVPMSASPSRGVIEDDVPARLQPDEFVIPRDVVHHRGTRFFNKLIEQSRAETGQPQQPVGGKMKPPLAGPPRFQSHAVPSHSFGGVI